IEYLSIEKNKRTHYWRIYLLVFKRDLIRFEGLRNLFRDEKYKTFIEENDETSLGICYENILDITEIRRFHSCLSTRINSAQLYPKDGSDEIFALFQISRNIHFLDMFAYEME
ncbi:hypothetical protein PFISCL1PPCAC_530, partial [Pristionchus fissidentatus]